MWTSQKLTYHQKLTCIQILFTRLGKRIYKNLLRMVTYIVTHVMSFTSTPNNSLLLKTFNVHLNMDLCLKLVSLIMKKIESKNMNSLERIKRLIAQSSLTFKTLMLVLFSWTINELVAKIVKSYPAFLDYTVQEGIVKVRHMVWKCPCEIS